MSKTSGRVLLPPTINPTHYSLSLTPNLSAHTFTGLTKIHLSTTQDVSGKEIKMHAKELCFANASFVVRGEAEMRKREVVEIRDNKKETTVVFVFEEDIPKGVELEMTIEYSVRSFVLMSVVLFVVCSCMH
jgi:aminopeptidase 2